MYDLAPRPTPPSVSKLSLFPSRLVCRRWGLLTGNVGGGGGLGGGLRAKSYYNGQAGILIIIQSPLIKSKNYRQNFELLSTIRLDNYVKSTTIRNTLFVCHTVQCTVHVFSFFVPADKTFSNIANNFTEQLHFQKKNIILTAMLTKSLCFFIFFAKKTNY